MRSYSFWVPAYFHRKSKWFPEFQMLKLITTSLKRRFENVENITTAELHNNINNSNNILIIDTRNEVGFFFFKKNHRRRSLD